MFVMSRWHTYWHCRKKKQAGSVSSYRLGSGYGKTGVRLSSRPYSERSSCAEPAIPLTVNAAHKIDPSLSAGNTAHDPATSVYKIRYDVSKAAKILGIKYITLEQSTKDTLAQAKEKGWY